MDKFYFFNPNGYAYYDFPLNATNLDDAIAEVKKKFAYTNLYLSKTRKKKLNIVNDYVEVYKNKRRADLTFEDLRNPEVYRRVY